MTGTFSNFGEISLSFGDNRLTLRSDGGINGGNTFSVSEVSATGLGKESLNISFTKSI